MRTLVIGDIHGGLKALKQVIKRAAISESDMLVFLGDYVDGWSEGAGTVAYLMALSETHNCVFIRGNHDDLCHQWLETGHARREWLAHGGQESMDSYKRLSESEKQKHIAFFRAMENYHIDRKNRLFVHAGFQNMGGPQREFHPTPFYWDRTLWEMALVMDKTLPPDNIRYPKRLKYFSEIYIGHTPVTRINRVAPTKAANVWNIDTGAAFMGKLTIMDVDTKDFWQSDPVWELYPDERGRN